MKWFVLLILALVFSSSFVKGQTHCKCREWQMTQRSVFAAGKFTEVMPQIGKL